MASEAYVNTCKGLTSAEIQAAWEVAKGDEAAEGVTGAGVRVVVRAGVVETEAPAE